MNARTQNWWRLWRFTRWRVRWTRHLLPMRATSCPATGPDGRISSGADPVTVIRIPEWRTGSPPPSTGRRSSLWSTIQRRAFRRQRSSRRRRWPLHPSTSWSPCGRIIRRWIAPRPWSNRRPPSPPRRPSSGRKRSLPSAIRPMPLPPSRPRPRRHLRPLLSHPPQVNFNWINFKWNGIFVRRNFNWP